MSFIAVRFGIYKGLKNQNTDNLSGDLKQTLGKISRIPIKCNYGKRTVSMSANSILHQIFGGSKCNNAQLFCCLKSQLASSCAETSALLLSRRHLEGRFDHLCTDTATNWVVQLWKFDRQFHT